MKKAILALIVLAVAVTGFCSDPVIEGLAVQEFIEDVRVQILVYCDYYSRPLHWYQEEYVKDAPADMEIEWKCRKGDWCKEPERIIIGGSGVILYSDILPEGLRDELNAFGSTYILTNAHVVYPLIKVDFSGSRWNPLEIYAEEDLIRTDYPPNVEPDPDARPITEAYYTIDRNYVTIKHRVDQLYEVQGTVVAFDQDMDVALIQIRNAWGFPYAIFRESQARVGEECYIAGAPLGIPFSLDRGRVNQVDLDLGRGSGIVWNNQIKIDIAAAPGSSGSGIFDLAGDLIAELHGTIISNGVPVNGGQLAINGVDIREWLTWNGWSFITCQLPYPVQTPTISR